MKNRPRLIRPGKYYFDLADVIRNNMEKEEGRRISHREITDMTSKFIIDEHLHNMIFRKKRRGLL